MQAPMEVKVSFYDKWDYVRFLKLLRAMQWYGAVGHSGCIAVHLDGDGVFKMDAQVKNERGEYVDLRDQVKFDENTWKALKKENEEYQARRNPEIRDNVSEFPISFGGD